MTRPLDKELADRLRSAPVWQPIESAPKDGRDLIVGVDIATVWIVRSAWYRGRDVIEQQPETFDESDIGWWSYIHSVTQEKLEGIYEPTHWLCEAPAEPEPEQHASTNLLDIAMRRGHTIRLFGAKTDEHRWLAAMHEEIERLTLPEGVRLHPNDVIELFGTRYALEVFRSLGLGQPGDAFRIVAREADGVIVLQRIAEPCERCDGRGWIAEADDIIGRACPECSGGPANDPAAR